MREFIGSTTFDVDEPQTHVIDNPFVATAMRYSQGLSDEEAKGFSYTELLTDTGYIAQYCLVIAASNWERAGERLYGMRDAILKDLAKRAIDTSEVSGWCVTGWCLSEA